MFHTEPGPEIWTLERLPSGAELSAMLPEVLVLVSVRMMTPDAEGRLRPAQVDAPFELTLCA